jgi:hypothetical protein
VAEQRADQPGGKDFASQHLGQTNKIHPSLGQAAKRIHPSRVMYKGEEHEQEGQET